MDARTQGPGRSYDSVPGRRNRTRGASENANAARGSNGLSGGQRTACATGGGRRFRFVHGIIKTFVMAQASFFGTSSRYRLELHKFFGIPVRPPAWLRRTD